MDKFLPPLIFPEIVEQMFAANIDISFPSAPAIPPMDVSLDKGFLLDKKKSAIEVENEQLRAELVKALEGSKEKEEIKAKYEQDMHRLLDSMDEYERRINADKKRMEELKAKVQSLQQDLEAEQVERQFKAKSKENSQIELLQQELEQTKNTISLQLKDALQMSQEKTKELEEVTARYESLLSENSWSECKMCFKVLPTKGLQTHYEDVHFK